MRTLVILSTSLFTCSRHGDSSSHPVMGLRHLLGMVTLSAGSCSLTLTLLIKGPEGGSCTTRKLPRHEEGKDREEKEDSRWVGAL